MMVDLEQVKLAITMDDGSLVIVSFLTVGHGSYTPDGGTWIDEREGIWSRPATDANIMSELFRSFPEFDRDTGERRPQPKTFRRIADADIPNDRRYRSAWKDDGAAIVHDMPKAREIHLRRIRNARGPRLDQLDRDWNRAYGRGKKRDADAIEAKREELRELPATLATALEAAQTIAELEALTGGLEL